jgi:hypothetical protein
MSPARFVAFAAIGGLGVAVHFVVLAALFGPLHVSFAASQTAAALVAMTSNFALNNALTYRDRRLRGWAGSRAGCRSRSCARSGCSPTWASPPISLPARPPGCSRRSPASPSARSGTMP